MSRRKIKILGCYVDVCDFYQTTKKITDILNTRQKHTKYGVTPNSEILLACRFDIKLKKIINQANLSTADGAGLLWAAKYNSLPLTKIPILREIQAFFQLIVSSIIFAFKPSYAKIIPERVTGTDLVPEIAKICAEHKKSLFLLGAGPGVAQKTALRLQSINSKLQIAGTSGQDHHSKHDRTIIETINKSKADCLLIAYGAPRDQYWIARNKDKLATVRFVLGVGGAFDFITEETSILGGRKAVRAPLWMRNWHLEWLHRLYYQPDRIGRIINAVFYFPLLVMVEKIYSK